MPMTRELKHFLSQLSVGIECVPGPANEGWADHVKRISVPGRIAQVSEEQYFYWLDVLPPKFMSGSLFCFAEGAEPFRVFTKDQDNRHWVRQMTWDETTQICRLARIPLPS